MKLKVIRSRKHLLPAAQESGAKTQLRINFLVSVKCSLGSVCKADVNSIIRKTFLRMLGPNLQHDLTRSISEPELLTKDIGTMATAPSHDSLLILLAEIKGKRLKSVPKGSMSNAFPMPSSKRLMNGKGEKEGDI
jgi:hypothetical protein